MSLFSQSRSIFALLESDSESSAERSSASSTLQLLLDALPSGLALVDKHGTVLLTNQAWEHDKTSFRVQPGDSLHDASYDDLTGAATRRWFYTQAERALEQAQVELSAFTLVYLDLDDFKRVNDSYGHAVGDALLQHVCSRISKMLRDGDILARFGGEEFVLLLQQLSPRQSDAVLGRLRALFETPFMIEGHRISVTASLGDASYPGDGVSIDGLLRRADSEMYRQKATHQRKESEL